MKCVLVLASGAEWESAALGALNGAPGLVVLKRCVDVSDLMAAATTGQADVAVVAMEAPGSGCRGRRSPETPSRQHGRSAWCVWR